MYAANARHYKRIATKAGRVAGTAGVSACLTQPTHMIVLRGLDEMRRLQIGMED